jgi:hypothetical protein
MVLGPCRVSNGLCIGGIAALRRIQGEILSAKDCEGF